jgi:hypothetical protein
VSRPRRRRDKASPMGSLKMIAVINDGAVIKKILEHTSAPLSAGLGLWEGYTAENTMKNARASLIKEDPAECEAGLWSNNYIKQEPFDACPELSRRDGWVQAS